MRCATASSLRRARPQNSSSMQVRSFPELCEGQLAERVLYHDGLVVVIDKPAGIAVHPGPGGGPDLESGFDQLRFGLPQPPALAHRLDRDTSGCLVLGRHPKALRRLGALFAGGQVEKVYWAVVEGRPAEPDGRIETGLKKLSRGTGWRVIIDPGGHTSFGCIVQHSAVRWSAMPSMAARHPSKCCTFTRGRSRCRSTRRARRSK